MHLQIHFDGSHRRRQSHYGFIVTEDGEEVYSEGGPARPSLHGFPGRIRSNDCEVFAALQSLRWADKNRPGEPLTLISDSRTVTEIRSTRPSDPYVLHWQAAVTQHPGIVLQKVAAHSGDARNEAADRLARRGANVPILTLPTEPPMPFLGSEGPARAR